MKQASPHHFFLTGEDTVYQDPMPFFMQPIMQLSDGLICGFEILYRGGAPAEWSSIDRSVLEHLCTTPANSLPAFFVNICSSAFLELPNARFVEASRRHQIQFEMNDCGEDLELQNAVVKKMEALCSLGVRFALDNYGRRDRHALIPAAFNCISTVKIDGQVLTQAMDGNGASSQLEHLLEPWHDAGVPVVAERIETPEMLSFAQDAGFEFVQGFHIDGILNGLQARDLTLL